MTIKGNAVALLKAVLCSCALLILTSLQAAWAQDPVACTKAGIGPQSPRDLTKIDPGTNPVTFAKAPSADKMRLCNVHFHQFAEHKGKGYSGEAGKGDNKGFACNEGPAKPKAAGQGTACKPKSGHGTALSVGDTIEVHWVFTIMRRQARAGPRRLRQLPECAAAGRGQGFLSDRRCHGSHLRRRRRQRSLCLPPATRSNIWAPRPAATNTPSPTTARRCR